MKMKFGKRHQRSNLRNGIVVGCDLFRIVSHSLRIAKFEAQLLFDGESSLAQLPYFLLLADRLGFGTSCGLLTHLPLPIVDGTRGSLNIHTADASQWTHPTLCI